MLLARGLTRANVRTVRNASGPELWLYDEIGSWGVTASDVATALSGLTGQRVTVRVNSPGGEVFDGIAIYNLIRNHPGGSDVIVDGLAASAASFIAMAGQTVTMAPHSRMMIHDAIGLAYGNAQDMRDTATLLDDLSTNIADIYAARAGTVNDAGEPDSKAWRKRMLAETWLSPQQAVDLVLADSIAEPPAADTPDEGTDGEADLVARWRESVAYQAASNTRGRATIAPPVPSAGARPATPAPVLPAVADIRSIMKGATAR